MNVTSNSAISLEGNSFYWDENLGSADASTLGIMAGSRLPRVIAVTSHRTGRTIPFRFQSVKHLDTGDQSAVAIYSGFNGFQLHIYND